MHKVICIIAATILMLGGAADNSDAQSNRVDFAKYMQSAASASAVASAIAVLGHCPNPFEFSEQKEGDKIVLAVLCKWNDGESATSIVFDDLGHMMLPVAFRHSG